MESMVYRFLQRIGAMIVLTIVGYALLLVPTCVSTVSLPSTFISTSCHTCVYADAAVNSTGEELVEAENDDNDVMMEMVQSLEWVLKMLYLLMWPLLAVAGASLDNALVYGEIFFLDTMLWKFWQVIRNFTNFGIGLVFVGSILLSFFYQNSEKFNLKNILKNTFIAGVLVQMSWFLVAVLIDLSTIGVVSLGALPLNVLGQDKEHALANIRLLKPHNLYNIDGTKETTRDLAEQSELYSCEKRSEYYYLACQTDQGKFYPFGDTNTPKTWMNYATNIQKVRKDIKKEDITIDNSYCVRGYNLIENRFGTSVTAENIESARKGADPIVQEYCSSLDEYVEKAAGMTGPLYALFAVTMNMSRIATNGTNMALSEAAFTFLIKALVGLALILPLFALCVILIIRVVILWLIIAFSPLLSLLFIFGKKDQEFGKIMGGNITNMTDILTLIFLPVFAVFAISMSLVFLSLIINQDIISEKNSCEVDPFTLMGCELDAERCASDNIRAYTCYGVEFTITDPESNYGSNIINLMGWLVQSMLGIAVMWAAVFLALKSNRMTAGVAKGIEGFGKQLAMAAPIIPAVGSIGGLKRTLEKAGDIPRQVQEQQFSNSGLQNYLDAQFADFAGSSKEGNKKLADAATGVGATPEKAKDILKGFTPPANTNARDYDANLTQAIGRAMYDKPDKFANLESALQDTKVADAISRGDFGDNFLARLHQTGNYQTTTKQNLERAYEIGLHLQEGGDYKVATPEGAPTPIVWHRTAQAADRSRQYIQTGKDAAGKYTIDHTKKGHIIYADPSANMTKTGLETLGKIAEEAGGLAYLPSEIKNHYDPDFITHLQGHATDDTFTYTLSHPDADGKEVTITLTPTFTDDTDNIKHITGWSNIAITKKDKTPPSSSN